MPFCPSPPGWFGCLFFTKWGNGGAELWLCLQWPEQGSLQSSEGLWLNTEKLPHLQGQEGINRAPTISGIIPLTAWQNILSGRCPQASCSPTLQRTAPRGTEPQPQHHHHHALTTGAHLALNLRKNALCALWRFYCHLWEFKVSWMRRKAGEAVDIYVYNVGIICPSPQLSSHFSCSF